MANKEKIIHILQDIKKLESSLINILDAEIYPASFFNESFDLSRQLLKDLYQLEADQFEDFRKQLEIRQAMLTESLLQESSSPVIPETPIAETPTVIEEEIEPSIVEEEIIIQEETIITETPEEEIPIVVEEEEKPSPVRTEKTIEELLKEHAPSLIPEKTPVSLVEVMEKKNLADFRKAFSLNDRFYFLRELFAGDDVKMNLVIADLNETKTLEEAMEYLDNNMKWDTEEAPVADFIRLLEKRYS